MGGPLWWCSVSLWVRGGRGRKHSQVPPLGLAVVPSQDGGQPAQDEPELMLLDAYDHDAARVRTLFARQEPEKGGEITYVESHEDPSFAGRKREDERIVEPLQVFALVQSQHVVACFA